MKLAIFTILLGSTSVLAGCNCKCQDPSGTGPQWNDLTQRACGTQLPGENGACALNKQYHGDQHHQVGTSQDVARPDRSIKRNHELTHHHNQCSSSFCCIDSGGFNDWCKANGAPGAYCW
ncbi:hypothetical protein PG996_006054 [Apiospora saccharicola]|uniref:Secreted protein n=1 Tax=Apiospora saccharicola TaxID=335842 RepID=A0ABR1VN76_9PEZI